MDAVAVAATGSVIYLADISSDGTSSGIIMTLVRLILAAIAVILAGGFGLNVARIRMDKSKASAGETKELMDEAKNFALAEGLLISVWAIIEIAHGVFSGALSIGGFGG